VTDRDDERRSFLIANGLRDAELRRIAGDASVRRYDRATRADGTSLVLVDTPDPEADLVPFIKIGRFLADLGLSAPAVVAADVARGLALQEDFGYETFASRLEAGADPVPLHDLGVGVLIELRRRIVERGVALPDAPPHDATAFAAQVGLWADVVVPLSERSLSTDERAEFDAVWRTVLDPVDEEPSTLVLRDHHVGNLMPLDRPGIRAVGLIDFQNAGPGPAAYDLVSILEDARRDVPEAIVRGERDRYARAFPDLDARAFDRAYSVLGAARHLRVVAVFTRLAVRDGRRDYLRHLPRVLRLFGAKLAEPALEPVARWFERRFPGWADPGLWRGIGE